MISRVCRRSGSGVINNATGQPRHGKQMTDTVKLALQAGGIYSFRTSPINKFSAAETGRYGALKVLAVDKLVTFIVLEGVFKSPPTIAETTHLQVLNNVRFNFAGRPALRFVPVEWSIDLLDFAYVGHQELTEKEIALIPHLRGYGLWSIASHDVEGEWRWRHDQQALREEVEKDRVERETHRQAERLRYETRLKHLTWKQLLDEETFPRWVTSPPFPPAKFTEAARDKIRATTVLLQGLGIKPKKREVRSILRSCVEWFNDENQTCGEPIETEEREDICQILSDLAYVAGHPTLASEIDEWKTW
jgi:hypothetical protein